MKTYRETLDALRFTPQQKAAIAEDLLAAAQAGQVRAPRRKWGRVAAAAILAAALCAACASGALQEALSVLASQFGSDPKQQEVIGDLTRPSAASATDNGVTISVDAVMGDGNSLVVLYRMERADGQPVLPQTEETKNVSDGNNTLMFEQESAIPNYTQADLDNAQGFFTYDLHFLDFVVSDCTLYFYQTLIFPMGADFSGPIETSFENLYSYESYINGTPASPFVPETIERTIPLVDGSWTLNFSLDLNQNNAILDLGSGQTFHAEITDGRGISGTIESIRLSPLSFTLLYQFTLSPELEETLTEDYYSDPELEEFISLESYLYAQANLLTAIEEPFATLTDGTQTRLFLRGSSSGSYLEIGKGYIVITFDEVLPLDTVASITIGDLTIPLPDA